MSSLSKTIKEIIPKAFPSLCEDTQEKLVSTLVISGVESAEDLQYIQQEDIKDLLPVIQQIAGDIQTRNKHSHTRLGYYFQSLNCIPYFQSFECFHILTF
ncbi:hypothetical protein ATANTOWER_011599 [Ataeniobius toweri]|uniref:Uncharacterized protein n=1 Tax=Ataeniobius toweri TaxID=208326 RepID=A0ABU7A6B7_9TELE|nr:hypothetical protein [Ataeniobius toweri]